MSIDKRIEEVEPDENKTFEKIIAAMGKIGDTTREQYGHAVRPRTPKRGLMKGQG